MSKALLFGHDATVWNWAVSRWGDVGRTPDMAIGILDNVGALKGALLLSGENTWTAELSIVSDGVISPGVTKQFFRFVFGELGVHRLQMRTQRNNKAIKRTAPKMGWTFEGVSRGFYGPHGDALLFYMTPQTCRWIKNENAKSASATQPRKSRDTGERTKPERRLHAIGV